MPGEYSHKHGVTVHKGPMAGTRGDNWEQDAVRLEEQNQRMIENPMQTLPNSMTSIDKAHLGSKSDEGTVDKTDNAVDGDHIQANQPREQGH